MCGIVALFSPSGPLPPGAAQRATDALAHRGPDGRGLWTSADGRVALGHTRLSMVDPLADQPLASEAADLHLVVNGEFYDFERIQRELRDRGHQLRTRSDSEIALHLYQERGTGCLTDLRGEFAFALWDQAEGRLFAARDRFGIKPLFYAQVGSVLVLASEVKALLAAGVPAAWDEETVHDALHLAFDASRTLFRGIRQVPPAHLLVAGRDGIRLERYWDIPYPARREAASAAAGLERPGAVAEAVEHTRRLLDEAVALRLRADVPVGCLLSGGVDSSAVLGIAARHAGWPVAAFTIGFNQAAYDESEVARATTAAAGGEFHLLPVDDRDLADAFPDAVRAGEMLQFNAHGTARYLLAREISRAGYKTVMAGEGGDEAFAGYAFLRAAMPAAPGGDAASGALVGGTAGPFGGRLPASLAFGLRLLRPATPAQRRLASASPWLARVTRGLGLRGPAVDTLVARLSVSREVLAPGFLERHHEHDPYRELYRTLDARDDLRTWEPARSLLYLWLRTLFASYHLAADRLDMAHAVEVRMPLLDHVLWEHLCRYPVSLLARDGQNKYLLREAVRPSIPDAVYHRTKQPFLAPPAAATPGNPLHDFAQDTLRGSSLAFVDRAAVVRLLDGLPSRSASELQALEALLMALVSLTILDRTYFGGGSSGSVTRSGCPGSATTS